MLQHPLNCQLIDRIKLPVYFFTTIITRIPMTVADTTNNAIPATDGAIENVCTANN